MARAGKRCWPLCGGHPFLAFADVAGKSPDSSTESSKDAKKRVRKGVVCFCLRPASSGKGGRCVGWKMILRGGKNTDGNNIEAAEKEAKRGTPLTGRSSLQGAWRRWRLVLCVESVHVACVWVRGGGVWGEERGRLATLARFPLAANACRLTVMGEAHTEYQGFVMGKTLGGALAFRGPTL